MLKLFLENAIVPIYGLTFLVSLYCYPKYFDTYLKYLPILFIYTFFNEVLGRIIKENPDFRFLGSDSFSFYNMVIYNVYSVIFYLYFFYIYKFYIDNERIKTKIQYASIFFLIVATINPFFEDFVTSAQTGTYVVGGLILLGCIALYLKQIFTEKNSPVWKNNILFWVSLGLSIFYIGYLPIKVMRFYNLLYGSVEGPNTRLIQYALIIAMYICIIIGFLRMRRHWVK